LTLVKSFDFCEWPSVVLEWRDWK